MTTLLAVSMGDPVGIGPEVLAKAATVADVWDGARLVVFGDARVLRKAGRDLAIDVEVVEVTDPLQALEQGRRGRLPVVAVTPGLETDWGQPTKETDAAQLAYVEAALRSVQSGAAHALTTGPINKTAIHRAGSRFSGHTDMLGHWFGVEHPVMMLAGPSLKVIPLTVHVALRDVPRLITPARLSSTIDLAHETFRRFFGHPRPRVAVAGLNPHAGEEGIFGDEEAQVIGPAIEAGRGRGIDVRGPFSADSIFHRATAGEFDVVIGMYHDQALIPLKLLDFDHAVNVTLGLPIVRTSVDHGTAYDIAGQGVASASSMIEALRLAARMAGTRRWHEASGG